MRGSQAVRRFAGAMVAAVLLAGPAAHAGAQFAAYEGWDKIQHGQGGDRKVVDGVDFWTQGSPPRRFQILGSITGERRRSGFIGAVATSGLESDVARRARDAGGDAVILADSHDVVHPPSYLVVKYLPDDPTPAPAYKPLPEASLTVRY